MDFNFGEYITKEYGLLRQILSYLKPRDLYNARFVCREWERTVDNLVDKNLFVITYKDKQKHPMPLPTKPILPDIVIYQNAASKEFQHRDICPDCKKSFLICYCQLIGPRTAVLALNNIPVTFPYDPELYTFWQLPSVFTLSFPENITLCSCSCENHEDSKTKFPTFWSQNSLSDVKDLKGVFIVSRTCSHSATNNLMNALSQRDSPCFAVGGGVVDKFAWRRGEHTVKNYGVYIAFRGENVTAHSELISGRSTESIEKSMSNLKNKVGEIPEGGIRIAFIAQCVDRRDENLEKLESGLFRKYFPDVPQCGINAWGEYGINSGNTGEPRIRKNGKRTKLNFIHSYTTSILICTLKKT